MHALNRLTFGPRPGDVDRVMAMGLDKWIDQQLHPDKIDDSALEARLAPYRTLGMSTQEMVGSFPPEQLIRAIAKGKASLPTDPTERVVYEAQLEKYSEKMEQKKMAAAITDASEKQPMMQGQNNEEEERQDRLLADVNVPDLLLLPPTQRMNAVFKLSSEDQITLTSSLKGEKREQLMQGLDPEQREMLMALNNPQQVINQELFAGKILRATYSSRQLEEVMTDFWFNHFNVFLGKGADRFMVTSYERDVIRPRALGKFEDLLVATAQSPAMLYYLDNFLSVGPNSDAANRISRKGGAARGKRSGLNENYGRELMELHTLGVNGGYTQKDVTEVARVFTGWTIKDPEQGGAFTFDERKHDPGEKIVLGHRVKPNGEKEGLEVLHILAHNPSTAKFICTKLATRFVSDSPPAALVDRMTHTFLKKNGDIREVLKTMLRSPEFWSPAYYRVKVKTPLEFVVSALRASGADVVNPQPLVGQLQTLGMPLYGAQPPTGYSMKSDTWVNSSALLGRMNFSLTFSSGRFKGVQVQWQGLSSDGSNAEEALAFFETNLLDGDVSKQTHDTIAAQLQDSRISQRKLDDPARSPNIGVIVGLLLGSPEFQRR